MKLIEDTKKKLTLDGRNFFLEIDANSKVEILKQLKTFVNIDDWHLLFIK